ATARYLALLRPYQQAPAVTRERLYLETVTEVLKNTHNILVDGGRGNILYLPLEQLLHQHALPKPAAATATTPSSTTQSDTDNNDQYERPSYPVDGGGR